MDITRLSWSADLPRFALWLGALLWLASLVLLWIDFRRARGGRWIVLGSGLLASSTLLLAVLRPVQITSKDVSVGPKVVVLTDTSRSMALRQTGEERRRSDVAKQVIDELTARGGDVRLDVRSFGEGPAKPYVEGAEPRAKRSDLRQALHGVTSAADERPSAIVVVSDGTLDDPEVGMEDDAAKRLALDLGVPISTVATTEKSPPDASLRKVQSARTAVAHVPLPLRVEVVCSGGLACEDLTVSAKELREDGPPALLASGIARLVGGRAVVELTVTLERAGERTLAIEVETPSGDAVPENNVRYMTFHVARERVRILHVAGRPTNDVRALRSWLKGNASVDVVAFFILRAPTDFPKAGPDELSLIPFPVDELFSEHLPSFDAIVLQDFDAQPYGLGRHLPAIQRYVRAGGGLVMVGGANSFVAGGYAGTPLASVLPVQLDGSPGASSADVAAFSPFWTRSGAEAPLLAPLREVVGEELPLFPGTNVLGDPVPGAVVLWRHPTRRTPSGAAMPVLAVGDMGDGRSVALGIDGSWMLELSALGARTAGRGYAALWDGLLGWLMRDPRFDPVQLELPEGCTSGFPATFRIGPLPDGITSVPLELRRADSSKSAPLRIEGSRGDDGNATVVVPPLESGGYVAKVTLMGGTTVKRELACEMGGDEWANTEVHPEHLARLAKATGGTSATARSVGRIVFPQPTIVSSEKRVAPLAPAWCWALLASLTAGVNWYLRRTRGLA